MDSTLLLGLLTLASTVTWVQSSKTNIIYILTDDQGHADVSWDENPTMLTPNLGKLKVQGTELLHFYTNHKCTPSRAALMTGRYSHRLGTHTSEVFSRHRNYTLDPDVLMMPHFLKKQQFKTHIVGKWHLGFCSKASIPTSKGFDTFFGSFTNTKDHFKHRTRDGYDWNWHRNGMVETYRLPKNTYNTYAITNHTVKLLDEHFEDKEKAKKPVFIYVSYLAPHKPAQSPTECWNNSRCLKFPADDVRRKYCGMVKCIDDGVGEIFKTLKKHRVHRKTIIVFHSDNGGTMRGGASNWPLRGRKQTLYEGGTKSRAFIYAPKLLRNAPKTYDGLVHITDMLPTLYTAVGGKAEDLPDNLDGIDQWDAIRNNGPFKREWMIYNINKVESSHAIRFRNASIDFKLHFDNNTSCPGWKRDPRPESERTDGRKASGVICPSDGFRLFNMKTNPYELEPSNSTVPEVPDAAKENPEVMAMMKAKLEEFKLQEVDVPVYTYLPLNGPGRSKNNNGALGVGDCEYNTRIFNEKQQIAGA